VTPAVAAVPVSAAATGPAADLLFEDVVREGATWSHVLKRGTALRITDTLGGANVGALFYNWENTAERYNMPDTLKAQHIARLTRGFVLYSDMGRVLCSITDDTVGWHDPLSGCANAAQARDKYGDLRYLAGNVDGASLSLSTFDGSSAYLIHGRLDGNGRMTGELIRADGSRDAFTAFRSADFDVVDPLQRVRVTSVEKRLDLAPLLSPRYAGKAVIVELFGTWCSNCNDLAPLLAELYKAHREAGLEVLSFAFELSADEGFVRERVAEYKAAHGVEWDVITPAATLQELLTVGPAQLSSISGVPVTLFFNRDRTVRAIYTGFSGPATGASHQRAAATFRRLTNEILDSR